MAYVTRIGMVVGAVALCLVANTGLADNHDESKKGKVGGKAKTGAIAPIDNKTKSNGYVKPGPKPDKMMAPGDNKTKGKTGIIGPLDNKAKAKGVGPTDNKTKSNGYVKPGPKPDKIMAPGVK
mgnify:CR=1 FL=1